MVSRRPRRALAIAVTVALVAPAAIFTLAQPAGAVVNQISTVAGNGDFTYNGDGIAATDSTLDFPQSVIADSGGNLLIADTLHNRVRVVAKSAANPGYPLAGCSGSCTWRVGDIFTVAGTGTGGYNNDGISATTAQLNIPNSVAVDAQGNVVISDSSNTRIRVVAVSGSNPGYLLAGCGGSCTWTTGDIFTVAGTGATAYNGDGIAATSADFGAEGVSVDAQGNLVIADTLNNRVRVVAVGTDPGYPLSGCSGSCTWTDGDAFTITGTGTGAYNGDGIAAGTAEVFQPNSAVADTNGNVVIGDGSNTRVRVVSVGANPGYPLTGCGGSCTWTTGDIFTVAGTGTGGYNGDGIAAGTAQVGNPPGVALDPQGNVLIADTSNSRVRAVAVSGSNPGYALRDADCPGGTCTWVAGDIFTVAGNGASGYSGDGLTSTSARVFLPAGVAVDSSGNVLIADSENERIRKVLVGPALAGFTVPANVGDPYGYDSGYSANNSVTLTASGTWDAGAGAFDPNGDSSLNPAGSGYLEPTVTGTALVGRIGTSGTWTKIGTGATTLNGTGELYLAMNDQLGAYGNNTGSVTVAIAAEINISSGYQGDGPVLAGTDVPWQGFVTNTGASALTNVNLLLLPGADSVSTPHFQEFDAGFSPVGVTTQCSVVAAGAFLCTVGTFAPGDFIEVDIDAIDTHGLAPQTLNDFFALLSSQTGGILSATAPISSTATQEVDGLLIHVSAPATVQEGSTLTLSGYVENTSATDDIHNIATFSQIDKGTVTSSTLCAFQNNNPTGASDRCPTAGTFTQPAGTDGSATPASVGINTNGLAGQTIHYTTVATSPDLGGNSEVDTGSVLVTPTPGNIVVTDPTSGSTWAGSATHALTAFPVPSSGHAVTSVDFWDGPPHDSGSTLLDHVVAPGPYTMSIPGGSLSSGLHGLYAEMHQDDAGATDFFQGVSVSVVGSPSVSIVPPSGFASGGTLNTAKTFTATAHATAPSTLTSVVWQIDGSITVPSAASAPYTATVDPASLELSAGSHSLTATATDSTGQSTTSTAFNFTIPAAASSIPTVTTFAPSITPGGDAAWTVEVDNTSANTAHRTTLTLHVTSTDSMSVTSDLSLDTVAMNGALHVPPSTPTCQAGTGATLVCTVGEIPGNAGVLFPVFVHTDGVTTGSTLTGTAVSSAANAADTAPKPLGSVGVASCGPVCAQSVVAAGTTFDGDPARLHTTGQVLRLSGGLQSVAHGVKFGKPFGLGRAGLRHGRVTFRPRLDTTPSVKVELNSYAPSASTDPIDANLCPTPTACVGEISEVSGGFTALTSKTNPIVVTIIAKWGSTVPGAGIWMQKPASGTGPIPNPIHLVACTINATTRAFNTPCILPEIVKTLTVGSTTTKTTYDTILFTGNDPHFCRR